VVSIGPAGYFYDQITGDGGPGDRIGPFEGRVIALGGAMTYNFALGKIPVSTRAQGSIASSTPRIVSRGPPGG
jgi:hypothetical protein